MTEQPATPQVRSSRIWELGGAVGRFMDRHWRGALISIGVLVALTFGVALFLSFIIDPTDQLVVKFWLGLLSGNWSPDSYPPLSGQQVRTVLSFKDRYWFGFFGMCAVLLNNAVIVAIIGGIVSWVRDRREQMALTLSQALQMLGVQMEVTLEDELSDVVPAEHMERTKIAVHHALVEARQKWETQTLDKVFGRKRATEIRSRLQNLTLD